MSGARIRADVEFLADDLLEGREAGTRGYDLAARYVASALEGRRLRPRRRRRHYFQQVPFIESTPTASSMRLTINGATTDVPLPDEGLVGSSAGRPAAEVTAPVVFAGFGVTAPDFGYDDYAGLDVTGKIVAILSNAPSKLPSEPRAHYASTDHKMKNAADHGAVGVVTVLGPDDTKRFPWEQVKLFFGRPTLTWANTDGTPGPTEQRLKAVAYLNPQGAARLFSGSDADLRPGRRSRAQGRTGWRCACRDADDDVGDHAHAHVEPQRGRRAEGQRPGAGGDLRRAHRASRPHRPAAIRRRRSRQQRRLRQRDGQRHPAGGGARAGRAAGSAERSVVVVLVTAEEKGLLGSDYFAHYPVKAAGRMVANVNLDMPVVPDGQQRHRRVRLGELDPRRRRAEGPRRRRATR